MRPAEGTVVIMDLDKFSEVVKERGWSEWRPNDATALLTELVSAFASKWGGSVIWGLDEERGTEEVVIEIPYVEPHEVEEDLKRIREKLKEVGVSISIVAVKDFVFPEASDRRKAYRATPGRRRAKKLLEKLKRSGGGILIT